MEVEREMWPFSEVESVKLHRAEKPRKKKCGSEIITVNILTIKKTMGDIGFWTVPTWIQGGRKRIVSKNWTGAFAQMVKAICLATPESLRDMPMEVPEELPLLAFSKREDPEMPGASEGVSELDLDKPLGHSAKENS